MTDDPIRRAFDLLEEDRPVPAKVFADALFDRLAAEIRTPAPKRLLPTRPHPRSKLSPTAMKILIAAAALSLALVALVPLLPLSGNMPQPAAPESGALQWIHTFSEEGTTLRVEVTAWGSQVYVAAIFNPEMYALPAYLYRYAPDGRRLLRTGASMSSRLRPIAADPAGGVFVAHTPEGVIGPVQRYSPDGTDLGLETTQPLFRELDNRVAALTADETGVFLVGRPAVVASLGLDGSGRWITELPASRRAKAIAVAQGRLYVVGTSTNGSPTLWTLDDGGSVTGVRTLGAGTPRAVAAAGDRVFIIQNTPDGASVSAFAVATRARLWTKRLGPGTSAADVAAGEAGVYVAGTAHPGGVAFVRAFGADGHQLWSTDVWSTGAHRPTLALTGTALYVSGVTGEKDGRRGFIARVALGAGPPRE